MIVRYWQPLQELDTLKQQLDRAFEDLVSNEPINKTTWTPSASVVDTGDNFVIQVQLAGINPETLDIQASRKAITISGERPSTTDTADHKVLYSDIRYGAFRRVLNLPVAIEHEQVKADYNHGILTVHLPKAAEVRNQVVKVSINTLGGPTVGEVTQS
jgi:HSP20 family protein